MGYTTDFDGQFDFDKPLTMKQYAQLMAFAKKRHGGNVNEHDGFPGFWLKWIPTFNGEALKWNGEEKFYGYVQWLEYLIKHFFEMWEIKLNGQVKWVGKQKEDVGIIYVKDNKVKAVRGYITTPEPDWSE